MVYNITIINNKKNQGKDNQLCGNHKFWFNLSCWCNVSNATFTPKVVALL
jgi:hypothetical protein